MNSKDFFEKLNIELDSLPPMSETLRNEPIVTVDPQEEIKTQSKPKVIKFPFTKQAKKIVTLVASVAVIFCTVIGLVFSGVIGGNPTPEYTVMQIDINPSFSVLLNSQNKAEKVVSNNADGDTVLSDNTFATSLKGKTAKEVALAITEKASEYGFINLNSTATEYSTVSVKMIAEKGVATEVLNEITDEINSYFKGKGVYLFAQGESVTQNYKEQIEEVKQKSVRYYNGVKESAEELKTYLETYAYGYAEKLLGEQVAKYELIKQTLTLLQQPTVDMAEVERNIDTLITVYGVEFEKTETNLLELKKYSYKIQLEAALGFIEPQIETIKELLSSGITQENLTLALGCINNEIFVKIIDFIINGETALDDIDDMVEEMLDSFAEKKQSDHREDFERPREEIDDDDYHNFIEGIHGNPRPHGN